MVHNDDEISGSEAGGIVDGKGGRGRAVVETANGGGRDNKIADKGDMSGYLRQAMPSQECQ